MAEEQAQAVAPMDGVRWAGRVSSRWTVAALVMVALALVPVVCAMLSQAFYVTLVSRMMIFALAALGLNLIVGYGGMVSFGHALYIGVGAYAVGILSFHGIGNGYVHLVVALGAGLALSLLIGFVCLRASGVAS